MDDFSAEGMASVLVHRTNEITALLGTIAQREQDLKKQVRLFSAFLDALPNPIFVKDDQAVFIACNRAYEAAFGIDRSDFIGKTVLDLEYLPPSMRSRFQQDDLELLSTGGETREELEMPFADGKPRTVLYQRKTFSLGEEMGGGMLGLIVDISQRKKTEDFERFRSRILEMLAEGAELQPLLQAVVDGIEQLHPHMACGIMLANDEGTQLFSAASGSLPAFYTEAINGTPIAEGVGSCGTAASTGKRVVVEDLSTHPYWQCVADLIRKTDLAACWSQPVCSSVGEILGTFAIYHRTPAVPTPTEIELIEHAARLVSIAIEKTRAEHTIRKLAFYDVLTGLPNRRLLDERLQDVCNAGRTAGATGALMLLDLDNFKPLNDRFGHEVGDLLLKELARRLQDVIRRTDTVARLGGDEFVVIVDGLSKDVDEAREQALAIAEDVRCIVAQPFLLSLPGTSWAGQRIEHCCTSSIGVLLFKGDAKSQASLLRLADEAMYQAKESGRNRVCLCEELYGQA